MVLRDMSLFPGCPGNNLLLEDDFLPFPCIKFTKNVIFDIFGEISVETVSLKFGVFNEKLGVVGGISLFLGILVTNLLSENDF